MKKASVITASILGVLLGAISVAYAAGVWSSIPPTRYLTNGSYGLYGPNGGSIGGMTISGVTGFYSGGNWETTNASGVKTNSGTFTWPPPPPSYPIEHGTASDSTGPIATFEAVGSAPYCRIRLGVGGGGPVLGRFQ